VNPGKALLLCGGLLALDLVSSACGTGDSPPAGPVAATQAELARIRSATLDLRLTGAAGSQPQPAGGVGFELQGPFQAPTRDGDLPVAKLESTRITGSARTTSTFLSDGRRAFVQTGGRTVELVGDQLAPLRGTTTGGADLGGLHLDSWFSNRTVTQQGDATRVTGALDAPSAINDVFALAGTFGADTKQHRLEGEDAKRLQGLVRSSEVELVTATTSHVPRLLRFDVGFGTTEAAQVAALAPALSGASLHFELHLTDVGTPVHVDLPPT